MAPNVPYEQSASTFLKILTIRPELTKDRRHMVWKTYFLPPPVMVTLGLGTGRVRQAWKWFSQMLEADTRYVIDHRIELL